MRLWGVHIKPRLSLYREILFRPWSRVLVSTYAALAFIQFVRDEFMPRSYKGWTVLSLIPSWPWWGWATGFLVLLVVIVLEGSYSFHRKNRATWRASFLGDNPEYQTFEKLWKASKLLAEGRLYILPGRFPEEGELEEWHSKVRSVLRDWDSAYDDYYVLNDKPNLGSRICHLENTLDWILVNTDLGKL